MSFSTFNTNMPTIVKLEIENFVNSSKISKSFVLPSEDKVKFTLWCNPQSTASYFAYTYTTIYLKFDRCDKEYIKINYKMSILNKHGEKCWIHGKDEIFYSDETFGGLYQFKYREIIDPSYEFLVNGKLTIYCEVKEIGSNNSCKNEQIPESNQSELSKNLETLLESTKFSDAALIIGDRELKIHKNMLAARSKVFAVMFENDYKEKLKSRVEIIDMRVDVCQQMLRYIYTGVIPELSEYAEDLLVAADKYQLDQLKLACEQHMVSSLDIESVANVLYVADMHHATLLKSKCIDFIVENLKQVMATSGWKKLIETRIELTIEMLSKISLKD